MKKVLLLLIGLTTLTTLAINLRAEVTLPPIFSDHAVLQTGASIPVWGKAAPGEKVTVTLGTASAAATTAADGKWRVNLDLHASGPGPFELVAQGANRVVSSDVLVGEVWFCSGQSNMELPMTQVTDAKREIAESTDASLRQFKVAGKYSLVPMEQAEGKWTSAAPETTGQFTAAGYFFARRLRKELGRPVGLVNATWGGTFVQSWTSAEALDAVPALKPGKDKAIAARVAFDNYVPLYRAWEKQYGREDRPTPDPAAFAGPDVPTDTWKAVMLPARLATDGLPDAGAVWIRREITVTPEMANHSLDLFLGDLRDVAQVYWNGHKIAESSATTIEQRYAVKADLVQLGTGVLAVRIFNPAAGLGIEPGKLRFRYGGNTPLAGEWLAKSEFALPPLDAKTLAEFPRRPALPYPSERVATWLFNGMVAPLIPYGIRGFAWYQGEQSVPDAYEYRTAFPVLINDWRARWSKGNLPFYFCQLPNNNPHPPRPLESPWAELREAQARALTLPATGMATLIDVGEEGNIHPKDKQDVGDRLARLMLANTYGKPIPCTGPVFQAMAVEGGTVRVRFTPASGKLVARPLPATYRPLSDQSTEVPLVRNSPGGDVEGFTVCGADKKWHWATARLDGETVLVSSDEVAAPVAIRYAWADNPVCNLYNATGLPAAPFRTDDFPLSMLANKY